MLNKNRNNNGNNREKFKEGNNMVEQERYIDLAYARVSTKGQSLERQEQSILKAVPDIQERYFFKDKYTGKDFESRPAFNELKKKIDEIKEINPQAKIRLTVHEIDRLGRDYNELLKEFIDLSEKGVVLNALDIPKEIAEQTGVAGNLVYMILILYKSAMAQQELEYKHKRTMEGIAVAKQNGVRFGRQAIEIDMVYETQRKVILEIAEKESCVIIGRNADFILKDRDDVLNVFIHGDMLEKVARICKLYNVTEEEAEKMMADIDKRRMTNYQFYTDQKWGMAKNYTLSLNSSELGYDLCEKIIMDCKK